MGYRDDLNVLRQMLARGEITPDDFANAQGGGSFGPEYAAIEEQGNLGAIEPPPDFGNVRAGHSSRPTNVLAAMRQQQPPQPSLPELMPPTSVEDPRRWQSQPGSDLPMNSFRVESGPDAGRTRSLNFADLNPAWGKQEELQSDFSQPIEIAGVGKGYWEKGGTGNAIINGKRVMLGVDRDATMRTQGKRLALDQQRQGLAKGEMDMAQTAEQIAASRATRAIREDPTTQAALEKRYGKAPDGMRWKADGSGLEEMPGGKKEQQGNKALELVDMAEKLLDQGPTESYGGTAWDKLMAIGGGSNKGAELTAELKPIAGQLVAMMPRMEGPQSNYDVKLYQEMAGALGDSTVPVEQRKAAIKTLRALNAKYSANPAAGAAKVSQTGGIPEGAVAYLRANPGTRAQFDVKFGRGASQRVLGG